LGKGRFTLSYLASFNIQSIPPNPPSKGGLKEPSKGGLKEPSKGGLKEVGGNNLNLTKLC
jgi:hypothetical protein